MMIVSPLALAALAALLAWVWLVSLHGRFWRADQRLGRPPEPARWPAVAAVVPARNEAAHVGAAIASLLAQDYPGDFRIVLVDDASDDGTAAAALAAAPRSDRLAVISGRPLKPGWTGKLWAMDQGIAKAARWAPEAVYLLLTDADIAHDPGNLRRLVAKAEAEGRDLVSLMVRLRCQTLWEKLLIPPFVFFFQMLYPFPWVNETRRRTAAAAGGCMLVRTAALVRIGGIAAIHDRVIDDCALAAAVKGSGGAIWLGLADATGPRSLRGYDGLGGIWRMVARSAYVQLRHSPWWLVGTMAGMALLFAVPPLAFAAGLGMGDAVAAALGGAGWAVMWGSIRPTLEDYGVSHLAGLLLPAAALLYLAMTVDSARRSLTGQGAAWKGRTYAADSAKAE